MTDKFLVTLDRTFYKAKPDRAEITHITERVKRAGPSEVTRERFAEHVRRGGTWVPGCYGEPFVGDDGKLKWGEFESLQVVAVDIDNAIEEKDAEGRKVKRMLLPGERGYLSIPDALRLCELRGLDPMLLYTTFNHSDAWPRFRLVFDLGEPMTDEGRARAVIEQLLFAFNDAGDEKCKNPNRLYFGSNGNVKEAWRSWQVVADD